MEVILVTNVNRRIYIYNIMCIVTVSARIYGRSRQVGTKLFKNSIQTA